MNKSKTGTETKNKSTGVKALKIAWNTVVWLLTAVVAAVCVLCVYVMVRKTVFGDEMPSVFGYSMATVATGSMEPTISAGDLIVVKSCGSYEEGDVITFYDSSFGGYITHRIIGIEDGLYITQGDANSVQDSSGVAYTQVIGKVVWVAGGAGNMINFLQTPAGIICLVAVLACIWLIFKIVGIVIKSVREKKSAGGVSDGASDSVSDRTDGTGIYVENGTDTGGGNSENSEKL